MGHSCSTVTEESDWCMLPWVHGYQFHDLGVSVSSFTFSEGMFTIDVRSTFKFCSIVFASSRIVGGMLVSASPKSPKMKAYFHGRRKRGTGEFFTPLSPVKNLRVRPKFENKTAQIQHLFQFLGYFWGWVGHLLMIHPTKKICGGTPAYFHIEQHNSNRGM